MYYGTLREKHTLEIARWVVEVLGGGESALKLILETAMQETVLGNYRDNSSYGGGVGLCQCDPVAFYDTQKRIPRRFKDLIDGNFCIEVDEVHHRELAFSPLLSLLWCRMHYLLRPGAIPETAQDRGKYWKKWYNSELGKGTVDDYMVSAGYLDVILTLD